MKKYFGKSVLPSIEVQTNLDLQILIPQIDLLKSIGYSYDGFRNNFSITSLEDKIFVEKNIDNIAGEFTFKLKEDINSGFYPKYKIPKLINEELYWNNETMEEYIYFYIRSIDIRGFNNQNNEYQYIISYSDSLLSILLSNNYVGIRSEASFGMFLPDTDTPCAFTIEYNKYKRDIIILQILNIDIDIED